MVLFGCDNVYSSKKYQYLDSLDLNWILNFSLCLRKPLEAERLQGRRKPFWDPLLFVVKISKFLVLDWLEGAKNIDWQYLHNTEHKKESGNEIYLQTIKVFVDFMYVLLISIS